MKRSSKGHAITPGTLMALVLSILAAPGYVDASPADDIPCATRPSPPSPYEIDFSGITPAATPEAANRGFADRAQRITHYNACRLMSLEGKTLDKLCGLDSTTVAIAKLEAGRKCACETKDNMTQVDEALAKSQVCAKVGTDFHDISRCERTGDYDVMLRALITIMYRYGPRGQNKLKPETYNHVLHDLLNQRGPHDPNIENVWICGLPIPETENHILMIETSRYLTNQLLLREGNDSKYNNEANGMNEWMLRKVQQFLQNDFQEYNSRTYQVYTTMAIQNLYDFAEEPRVKVAAQMVLDYISAKIAVSSNGLRRAVPFRRLKESKDKSHLFDNDSDPQTQRFIILSGLTQRLVEADSSVPRTIELRDRVINTAAGYRALDSITGGPNVTLQAGANVTLHAGKQIILNPGFRTEPGARLFAEIDLPHFANFGGRDIMQLAAVGSYRVPDMILDLVMKKLHNSYYQFIKHTAVELYWSAPEFLITGGGFWHPAVHGLDEFNCYKDAGWALPTTLMPTGGGVDYKDFIRIDGDRTRSCIRKPICACLREDNERRNTCVAPGFACGLNPLIPQSYLTRPSFCVQERGPWTFINLTGSCRANPDYGIYVVVYSKPVEAGPPSWDVGFFEAASANAAPSFQSFIDGVLSRNGSLNLRQFEVNEYVTVEGRRIRFIPDVPGGNKYNWGIVSISGSPFDDKGRDIAKWPLAEGDIINSDGHSPYMSIDNPFLNRRLILDMRDDPTTHIPYPQRTEINGVGPSDKVVWVDFNYRGTDEYGTFALPYKMLVEGVRAIPWNGGTLKIKAGSTKEVITILNRIRIEASGGTVTIGR